MLERTGWRPQPSHPHPRLIPSKSLRAVRELPQPSTAHLTKYHTITVLVWVGQGFCMGPTAISKLERRPHRTLLQTTTHRRRPTQRITAPVLRRQRSALPDRSSLHRHHQPHRGALPSSPSSSAYRGALTRTFLTVPTAQACAHSQNQAPGLSYPQLFCGLYWKIVPLLCSSPRKGDKLRMMLSTG